MMIAMIIVTWMLMGVATFRYSGYAYERKLRQGHSYQHICLRCICSKCGKPNREHPAWSCGEADLSELVRPHDSTFFGILPLVLIGWPGIVVWYVVSSISKAIGLKGNFFAPAPAIGSPEERKARKAAERELAIAKRELEIEQRERELGINV